MKVSIIIVNYKSERLVRYCVEGIRRANPNVSYEIIVVNNDRPGSLDSVRNHLGDVVLIQADRNVGMGAGNNLGFEQASGEYLLVINPDIIILPNAIETMVHWFERNPRTAIVGPKLLNPDRTLQYSTYTFPQSWKDFFIPVLRRTPFGRSAVGERVLNRYLMKAWNHAEAASVDWVLGAAMMIRKSYVDSHGGFDSRYFLYNEDMDLCMQAKRHAFDVHYIPDACMIHYLERLSAEKVWYRGLLTRHAWIHISSWVKFFWKWRREIFQNRESRIENRGTPPLSSPPY